MRGIVHEVTEIAEALERKADVRVGEPAWNCKVTTPLSAEP